MLAPLEPTPRPRVSNVARSLLVTLTLTACAGGPSAPSSRASAPTSGHTPAHAVTRPATSGCECALRLNAAVLERARSHALQRLKQLQQQDVGAHTPHYPDVPPNTGLMNPLPCWDTPQGAWTVVMKHAAVCPYNGASSDSAEEPPATPAWVTVSRNVLAYVEASTCHVTESTVDWPIAQPDELNARFDTNHVRCETQSEVPRVDEPVLYDFNADGEAELWLSRSYPFADGAEPETHLLTFDGVKVRSYVPTDVHYRQLDDVDHDGRPDLVWNFEAPLRDDCSDHGHPAETPSFLARADGDGRFVTDDAVAKNYVQSWCSAPPRVLDSVGSVLCARLYGRSSDSVLLELEPIGTTDCATGTDGHPLSALGPALRDAARVKLPFALP